MTMTGTRGGWDGKRLDPFLREVRNCRPPTILADPLSADVLNERLLFDRPKVNDHGKNDPGFKLDLTGQFDGGDELWQTLAERADWIIEIDARRSSLRYAIAPTLRTQKAAVKRDALAAWLEPQVLQSQHPYPKTGPFFQARILIHEGSFGRSRSEIATFARQESGIRVYMEGFRVLPYGNPGDDWLKIDRDYVTRVRDFDVARIIDDAELPQVEKEGFLVLGNRSYFGAVLLTERGAPDLEMVVNREGFVPGNAFEQLTDIVRAGLDLSVRARSSLDRRIKQRKAVKEREDAERRASQSDGTNGQDGRADDDDQGDSAGTQRDEGDSAGTQGEGDGQNDTDAAQHDHSGLNDSDEPIGDPESDDDPDDAEARRITSLLDTAERVTTELDDDLPHSERSRRTEQLRATLEVISLRLSEVRDEQLILRTLAGVGTQYAAFVHEVNALLAQAQALRDCVDELVRTRPQSTAQRTLVREIRTSADELVQALTRQTSYLTDVVGPDARRRRRRMPVADRVESALQLIGPRLNARDQQLVLDIEPDIKTPPLFPSEMAIVLTNLLTNSVKFAGRGGRIRVAASIDAASRLQMRVENTGERVAPADYERLFETFQSSTKEVDVILGQGMGMGLPIVRSLVASYDGIAEFVAPSNGYATAVQVVIPDPRRRRQGAVRAA